MKTLFITLLVVTLYLGKASPLRCFTCPHTVHYKEDCVKTTECEESDNYCVTLAHAKYSVLLTGISKRCSPTCPGRTTIGITRIIPVNCCDTDLCNK